MKVTIVTIIDNQNMGTYLQAYALASVIKCHGHEVKVLNYRRERTKLIPFIKRIWKDKGSNPILAIVSILYRVVTVKIARKRLHRFLKSHVEVTKKYDTLDLYKNIELDANVYIAGSDQIWNSAYNQGIDGIYFLDFVRTDAKKIAYAASIGQEGVPRSERPKVKALLKSFDWISVRELSSINILQNVGVDNVQHVLDPTLLVKKAEWERIASNDSFIKTEPYLLVYSVEVENKQLVAKLAQEIAQERGLKVYVVTSGWFRERISCDRAFYFAKPERFLSLFYNADFVIVSSFHGTVFSLNFGKEFLSVSPPKYNSRVKSLLELLGIECHIVEDGIITKTAMVAIDYESVNKKIGLLRNESFAFLNKALI